MEYIVGFCFISYLFGSIPFGLLLTKTFTNVDLTKVGSGNIGATNVLRSGHKTLALATLILDAVKVIPAIICAGIISGFARAYFPLDSILRDQALVSLFFGGFAILGHCFPVWLQFKGGKGVATTFGVLLAAVPFAGMLAALTWILSALAGRMSSLAALSAMIMAPAYTYAIYGLYPALINVAISALVIVRHKENIKRIRTGTEPKIGEKKKQA